MWWRGFFGIIADEMGHLARGSRFQEGVRWVARPKARTASEHLTSFPDSVPAIHLPYVLPTLCIRIADAEKPQDPDVFTPGPRRQDASRMPRLCTCLAHTPPTWADQPHLVSNSCTAATFLHRTQMWQGFSGSLHKHSAHLPADSRTPAQMFA